MILKINADSLKKAKTTYHEQAQRMKTLKAKLDLAVGDIKDGWDTKAGDKFFEKYDTDWDKNITDYIEVIQHMSDNMKIADSKYEVVFNTAEKIKLH